MHTVHPATATAPDGPQRLARGFVDQRTVAERVCKLHCDPVGAVVTTWGIVGGDGDCHGVILLHRLRPVVVGIARINAEHERAIALQDGIDDPGIASATAPEQDQACNKENGQTDSNGAFKITEPTMPGTCTRRN